MTMASSSNERCWDGGPRHAWTLEEDDTYTCDRCGKEA